MEPGEQDISKKSLSIDEAAERTSQSFEKRNEAVAIIDHILLYLGNYEEPSITADMKAISHTGGTAELEKKKSQYQKALNVPLDLAGSLELELKRIRARIEWGWASNFVPNRQDVDLLKSSNYKHVLLSLHRMNQSFNSIDCSVPPIEDELFRDRGL